MLKEVLVECYCCRCSRFFYTENYDVQCCPHCKSRRIITKTEAKMRGIDIEAGDTLYSVFYDEKSIVLLRYDKYEGRKDTQMLIDNLTDEDVHLLKEISEIARFELDMCIMRAIHSGSEITEREMKRICDLIHFLHFCNSVRI